MCLQNTFTELENTVHIPTGITFNNIDTSHEYANACFLVKLTVGYKKKLSATWATTSDPRCSFYVDVIQKENLRFKDLKIGDGI